MCIVFFHFDEKGFCLAANREESINRPLHDPCYIEDDIWIAGKDFGPNDDFDTFGTWLGKNKNFLVAVTNRDDGFKQQIKSRGLLCISLLKQPSIRMAIQYAMRELKQTGFGGSNYLIASKTEVWIIHAPNFQEVKLVNLGYGTHCITNLNMDDMTDKRIHYIHKHLDSDNFVPSAKQLCQDEMIVVEDDRWGTICSSILFGDEIHHGNKGCIKELYVKE
jgi:uncharacterized protein with NRDE domain